MKSRLKLFSCYCTNTKIQNNKNFFLLFFSILTKTVKMKKRLKSPAPRPKSASSFVDTDFPANATSINSDYTQVNTDNVKWVRLIRILAQPFPITIISQDKNSPKEHGVFEGTSGHNVFTAALATVAKYPKLLHVLFTHTMIMNEEQWGEFRIRLYNFNKWTEVVVDDYIPCDSNGIPLYVKLSSENEPWTCLIHKAAAKMVGSYSQLAQISLCEVLTMLTGGVVEEVAVRDVSPAYFQTFKKMYDSSCLLCVGVDSKPSKIKTAHIYFNIVDLRITSSAQDVVSWQKKNFALKLRYTHALPSNSKLDDLPFSDENIKMLTSNNRRDSDQLDEFWTLYKDFDVLCHSLYSCYVHKDLVELVKSPALKLNYLSFEGKWSSSIEADYSASFPDTIRFWLFPQFSFKLEDPDVYFKDIRCEFVISLQQNEPVLEGGHIGFCLFRLIQDNATVNIEFFKRYNPVKSFWSYSKMCTTRHKLPAGNYLVVPIGEAGRATSFILKILTESKQTSLSRSRGLAVNTNVQELPLLYVGGAFELRGLPSRMSQTTVASAAGSLDHLDMP